MNKFALLLTSTAVFAACSSQPAASPSPSPVAQTQEDAKKEFEEIAKAMEAGQSVKCEMKKKDSNEVMTYMVKGKKVRITGLLVENTKQQGGMISDGEYFYTWTDDTKEGIKMKLPSEQDLEKIASQQGQNVPDFSKKEEQQKYEDLGYSVNCQVTSVADSEFIPPTNIKFNDLSQFMEGATKMMKEGSAKPASQEDMQKQVEEMMKQYQQ